MFTSEWGNTTLNTAMQVMIRPRFSIHRTIGALYSFLLRLECCTKTFQHNLSFICLCCLCIPKSRVKKNFFTTKAKVCYCYCCAQMRLKVFRTQKTERLCCGIWMKLCHCFCILAFTVGRTLPKPTFLGTIQAEHWAEFPAHLLPAALGVGFAAAAACAEGLVIMADPYQYKLPED